MWSLPTLDTLDASYLEDHLARGLWGLLLFRRMDETIRSGLERNWDIFNNALGPNAHVITLAKTTPQPPHVSLRFPENYEAAVGRCCGELGIRLDQLPALVLINGKANEYEGTPYWSLSGRTSQEASDNLVALVSDMMEGTRTAPPLLEPERTQWLEHATDCIVRNSSGRQVCNFIAKHQKILIAVVQRLLRSVTLNH
jgi:hypothetical protein